MSLLAKVRVVTLGTAHDLLDKVVDMNSPSVLRQYVRDIEDALTSLKAEAAISAGGIRTLTRKVGDTQASIAAKTERAKANLTTNQALAREFGSQVINLQKDLAQYQSDLESQQKTSQSLDIAVVRLETKHTQMVSAVRRLESMDQTSKAKEHAASALAMAGSATSVDVSIDNIEAKMQARADVADEKFDRAMNENSTDDPTHAADVDSFLSTLAPGKATSAA